MTNIREDLQKLSEGDIVPKRTLEGIAGKLLLFVVCVLILLGILAVYSSGASWGEKFLHKSAEHFLWRQLIFSLLGLTVVFVVGSIDYGKIEKWSFVLLVLSIMLLSGLLVLKSLGVIQGAARWLTVGPFKLQVSEFSKYAMIVFLASNMSKNKLLLDDFYKGYLSPVLSVGLTVGLIAIEPNFSTASLILFIGLVTMFLGGARLKHLLITGAVFVGIAAVFLFQATYRIKRLVSFVGLGTKTDTHQLEQALIGLGSGGTFGIGLGESLQREFLPLSYNDFIFAIIGEELGFLGCATIIALYAVVIICGVSISKDAETQFGKTLALGITFSLGLYAIVNMSVATGLLPTTGVVLPFISYGGSAMISNCFGVGLLISISRKDKLNKKIKENKDSKKVVEEGNHEKDEGSILASNPHDIVKEEHTNFVNIK